MYPRFLFAFSDPRTHPSSNTFLSFLPATDVLSMGNRSCKLTKQHGAGLARLETPNNSKPRQLQTQHVALPVLGLESTSH